MSTMRCFRHGVCAAAVLAMLFTAWSALSAPFIEVRVRPSEPAANLLKNADLAAHEGVQPVAWEFSSAETANFEVGWSDDGHDGAGSLRLRTLTGAMSGYWGQHVAVTPGETLMVQAWVRLTGGKLLLWLTGSPLQPDGSRGRFDQRYEASSMKQFFLAPTWIRRDYLRGPDPERWFLVHKAMTIPDGMTDLSLKIGSYFALGEMWLDDLYCGPARIDAAMTVRADPAGAALRQVQVLAIPGPTVVFDSGALGGAAEWTGQAQGLDATLNLILKVVTADGKYHVERLLPDPRGIR
ncbi:MAG: hypothetical protein GX595_04945 [Lentisphaerae bacterium]|nr:hypothetical protein [Lentisphaerota bacterium]